MTDDALPDACEQPCRRAGRALGRRIGEYESRMHRTLESEANLLGVVCTSAGIMTAAPYRVIAILALGLRGTPASATGDFSEKLHCMSEYLAALPDMRRTNEAHRLPPNTRLLAKGTNPDEGGSEIVIHETRRRGGVLRRIDHMGCGSFHGRECFNNHPQRAEPVSHLRIATHANGWI